MTPFEKIWTDLDKAYEEDMTKNKNDYLYKSSYAPDMKEEGYVTRNHNTQINLSSIATLIIQNVGRFCEHYASDFLIDWQNVQDAITDPNPNAKPVYVWMGLRESGVDGLAFIANRIAETTHYYRRLYSIRITHEKSDNYDAAAEIIVQFRDMTSHAYELYKYYRQNSYKSTDENKTLSSEEKQILIRENIHEIAYLVRKINALKEEIYNNIEDIDDEYFDLMDALINNEIDPYSVIRACTNTTDNS